jgi:hypothetical protein
VSEPSRIYFPLQANANSLVSGGPARSVRRRLVAGALMYERLFIDAGSWTGHSGPDAMTALRSPKARPPFQTGPERAADGRVPIGIELRIPGTGETIEQGSRTSVAWRATFEPFRAELEHAYPWIEFISVALLPEDHAVVEAMVDEDTADPGVAARMPDRNTRRLVIGNVDQSLVIGSGLVAAVSMDALHRNIVAARVARGQARPSFGIEALGIMFPAIERMTWADVSEARKFRGLAELRAVLAAVEAEAWERAQNGAALEREVQRAYQERMDQEIATLPASLRGVALTVGVGLVLGLVTGPLGAAAGLAAGAAQTIVGGVAGRIRHERSWMAAGIKLGRLASRRDSAR